MVSKESSEAEYCFQGNVLTAYSLSKGRKTVPPSHGADQEAGRNTIDQTVLCRYYKELVMYHMKPQLRRELQVVSPMEMQ